MAAVTDGTLGGGWQSDYGLQTAPQAHTGGLETAQALQADIGCTGGLEASQAGG